MSKTRSVLELLAPSAERANRGDRFESPFGDLGLLIDPQDRLQRILFLEPGADLEITAAPFLEVGESFELDQKASAPFVAQLQQYFAGRRKSFDLALAPRGTEFQREVWRHLLQIPFGKTSTYSDTAARLDRPRAARAVGRANATNPLPVIVPCHRLIGRDGSLTGFAGGLGFKRGLLDLEAGSV